jgi:diadenosine tetraphosphate (Ap4A) HIT family hydrolase
VHPLIEGHVLIIPKDHISCSGAFSSELFTEFTALYKKFSDFLKSAYGSVSTFEHGITGQTVFHAHIHLLPYSGLQESIIPEGSRVIHSLSNIKELQQVFLKDGKYLFFSIGDSLWTVNTAIGVPRFFRDRFAKALGVPERGNWKTMETNSELMHRAQNEILSLKSTWKQYSSRV